MKRSILTICTSLVLATVTSAGPMNPAHLPAETQWVVHIDVQSYLPSKLHAAIQKNLSDEQRRDFLEGVGKVESIGDVKLDRDLYDVTMFGANFVESDVVILINGVVKQDKLLPLISPAEGFKSEMYGPHQLMSWNDDDSGEPMFGVFYKPTLALLGKSKEGVVRALDVLDGKSPSLPAGHTLAVDTRGQIIFAGVADLSRAPLEQDAEMLKKIRQANFSVRESGDDLLIAADVKTDSKATASQLSAIANGGIALLNMAASQEGDDDAKALADLLSNIKVTSEDTNAAARATVAIATLERFAKDVVFDVDVDEDNDDSAVRVDVKVEADSTTKPAN
jgi:hypothetical protein